MKCIATYNYDNTGIGPFTKCGEKVQFTYVHTFLNLNAAGSSTPLQSSWTSRRCSKMEWCLHGIWGKYSIRVHLRKLEKECRIWSLIGAWRLETIRKSSWEPIDKFNVNRAHLSFTHSRNKIVTDALHEVKCHIRFVQRFRFRYDWTHRIYTYHLKLHFIHQCHFFY
jgi:hypothetical protein